ncbi:TPA: tRNA (adenosine(37)-N6)-threonylcarbamoyltransferase complex transferase subunit TsaD [Candidatus Micrarchaeota archaeon]|nr:tRNA (adenosine(37)-N6)-threonylcarbamoyltransferase complex transferase subunit TsaD [Candidatus Micrarchaeota archaeon]
MTLKVLGVESTAHTFGVSVVGFSGGKFEKPSPENTRVLSNIVDKYPSSAQGYIPRKLADHHSKSFKRLFANALEVAGVRSCELDAVAYSFGPGIGHCLHVGFVAAQSLSEFLEIPLIPVNHALAHVEITRFFCGACNPLVVYVSGGNSQIMALDAGRYRVFGETLDIGVGNLLDQVGRFLELDPPDALGVERLALKGTKLLPLPYSVKGMSFAFSGLLTALKKMRLETVEDKADACFSLQETAFSMLVEASERCLCHSRNSEVVLCGGNARSNRLKEMFSLMADEQGARFCVATHEFNGDNPGMIALTGLLMLRVGAVPAEKAPQQRIRIDSVKIGW